IEMVSENLTTNLNRLQDEIFTIEVELQSLNSVERKLRNDVERLEVYRLLPEMLGKSYEDALFVHIEQLHELLASREDLLFSATEENSKVKLINQKIDSKIALIKRSVAAVHNR